MAPDSWRRPVASVRHCMWWSEVAVDSESANRREAKREVKLWAMASESRSTTSIALKISLWLLNAMGSEIGVSPSGLGGSKEEPPPPPPPSRSSSLSSCFSIFNSINSTSTLVTNPEEFLVSLLVLNHSHKPHSIYKNLKSEYYYK